MLIKSSSPFIVLWKSVVGWWDNLIVLTLISIAWLACWFTIILGPPATFGLFAAIHELVEENTTTFRTAFDGARRYFLISWGWALINLLVVALLSTNWLFYGGIQTTVGLAIQFMTLALAFFWFGTQFYGLPFFFIQEKKSLFLALRNGAYTGLSSPLRTLVIWFVILVLLAVGIPLVLPMFLGFPALTALMGGIGVRERLITYGLLQPEQFEK